jgi:putative transposase
MIEGTFSFTTATGLFIYTPCLSTPPRYDLGIWGYCLMTNHVHLIAVPESATGLAKTLGRTHADYARCANAVRRGCGHLWQAHFYSCPMEKTHCWQALSYIEQNPVRAGLAIQTCGISLLQRPRPSRRNLPGGPRYERLLTEARVASVLHSEEWDGVLETNVCDEAMPRRLKEATARGIPFGSSAFARRLEESVGRDLSNRGPGRPKRLASTTTGE